MAANTTQIAQGINGNSGEAHPQAFHVFGPRNLSSPNWRDVINSSWKYENYRRAVMACFIQAAYLLELDRQENRTEQNALAPKWWVPFKFKLVETLIDERDRTIFGAMLEWDRTAAMADLILIRPNSAPRAVLALRGTILKSSTIKRDLQDDLRFLAWETLKGSVRFKTAFDAMKSMAIRFGSGNVCIAGHSLGAGFALQVGKALAKEGIYIEAHLFNPPSVSLAASLKNIGEKATFAWKKVRAMLPSGGEVQGMTDDQNDVKNESLKKWVPHLYINNNDYVCCYYTDPSKIGEGNNASLAAAKLFVLSKGNQKFLEAHKLDQWWADDLELQTILNSSKLISQQLKSLYQLPTSLLVSPGTQMTARFFIAAVEQ